MPSFQDISRWMLIAMLVCACLAPWPVQAQSAEFESAYREYKRLWDRKRFREAEPFAERALELGEAEFGPNHATTAILLNNLADVYRAQGRYGPAEPLYRRSIAIDEAVLGPEHPDLVISLDNLGQLLKAQARHAEAEATYRRALGIGEQALGPDHPTIGTVLNNLALLYKAQERHAEAASLFERSLKIKIATFGPEHLEVGKVLNSMAGSYKALGDNGFAALLYTQSLEILEAKLGPGHPDVGSVLSNRAQAHVAQARYGEAEPLFARALAIFETAFGQEHSWFAIVLGNLAALHDAQGRYSQAETEYQRSLAIKQQALGPEHSSVAVTLNNLADLYRVQGRYGEAEPLYKRSLAIKEKALGTEHSEVAATLSNLAELYREQVRHGEAEPLYRRALAVNEGIFGPEHPSVAVVLNNLAGLYKEQDRFGEAEELFERALNIQEKTLGPEHPAFATTVQNVAVLFEAQGRDQDAEELYRFALELKETSLDPEHPSIAAPLNNLAKLYAKQGRYSEAAPLYNRSLAITTTALGPEHPEVAISLNNLAALHRSQRRPELALDFSRRAAAIRRHRAIRTGSAHSDRRLAEQAAGRFVFQWHVVDALALAENNPQQREQLVAEAFESGQLAHATSVGTAISRMAARFAAGDDAIATLVRQRQDAAAYWEKLDKALLDAASRPPEKRDAEREDNLRAELVAVSEELQSIDMHLREDFPRFAELTTPAPIRLTDLQELLAEDEALVTYHLWSGTSFVFAIRHNSAAVHRVDLGEKAIAEAVTDLRAGLDPAGITTLADVPPFDRTRAFKLYQRLFAPIEGTLSGVRHVFVVPDGALQSLPLGVLVTEQPQGHFSDFSGYRQVPWLAKKYAMSVLPSVSSIRALRVFAERTRANKPFFGIGDPQLEGATGSGRGIELASLFTSRGIADVESVRQIASLPDTADELQAMAQTLGAKDSDLLLGAEATETRLKQATLNDHRVIAFATHGLVAGDLEGLAEPALVLTPPSQGSELDDGLLTASEVAKLSLNADWVILSACNTAAADGTPGAEGLSGLAKAFFYAGSRTLLVSHWPVASDVAVEITTRMLAEAVKPGIGRAEAHRRAVLATMNDERKPYYAHPMFWAPFVVVGEGGRETRAGE